MKNKTLSPHERGSAALLHGDLFVANPYPVGTRAHSEWVDGYAETRGRLRSCLGVR